MRAMGILEGKNDVELPKALPEQAPAPQPEAVSNEAPHSVEDTQGVLQPIHEAGSLGKSDNQGNAQDESTSVVRRHAFWTKQITDNLHALIVFLYAERIPCHFCGTPHLRRNLGISYDAYVPEVPGSILACSRCMPTMPCSSRGVGYPDDSGNVGTYRELGAYKADHQEMHT